MRCVTPSQRRTSKKARRRWARWANSSGRSRLTKGLSLQINDEAPIPAFKAGALWVVQTRLKTGAAYKYTWIADGRPIGGANNLPAFGPDSYAKSGVPQGKLTGPIEVPSKIYPDVKAETFGLRACAVGRRDTVGGADLGRRAAVHGTEAGAVAHS